MTTVPPVGRWQGPRAMRKVDPAHEWSSAASETPTTCGPGNRPAVGPAVQGGTDTRNHECPIGRGADDRVLVQADERVRGWDFRRTPIRVRDIARTVRTTRFGASHVVEELIS